MKYWSQPVSSLLGNHEQDDVIPASPGVITYHSQKTKVPKQTKVYRPLDLDINFIGAEIKTVFSWDLNFTGWESTIITCRLNSDITARHELLFLLAGRGVKNFRSLCWGDRNRFISLIYCFDFFRNQL